MPDVSMHARVVAPGALARITGRLSRLPERDFMVHADRSCQLEVVQQILEEQCSGPCEGDVRVHVLVRNPLSIPVAWDRLAVDL